MPPEILIQAPFGLRYKVHGPILTSPEDNIILPMPVAKQIHSYGLRKNLCYKESSPHD